MLTPLPPEHFHGDAMLHRRRSCGRCKQGTMTCKVLVQHTVNRAGVGRSYAFVCSSCKFVIHDEDRALSSYNVLIFGSSAVTAAVCIALGVTMAGTIPDGGLGGSLPLTLTMAIVFLGAGAGLGWMGIQHLRTVLNDKRDRENSPLLP